METTKEIKHYLEQNDNKNYLMSTFVERYKKVHNDNCVA